MDELIGRLVANVGVDEATARTAVGIILQFLANEAPADKVQQLIDKLTKPSGVSDEEALKRVAVIIQRAASNGLTEVQVLRFPNNLCTDKGRAINQREPGWEKTLTGLPKEMYDFWDRQLRDRGYKLGFQIVDWPGGMPGDIGITLKWV